jgi:hypothetical protein
MRRQPAEDTMTGAETFYLIVVLVAFAAVAGSLALTSAAYERHKAGRG